MAPLPSALNAGLFIAVASLVSFAVAGFAPVLNKAPGLRPSDSTRSVLMRVLVALLNLAAVVAFAYLNNIVIPKDAILTLLGAILGQTGLGHLQYLVLSNARQAGQGASVDPAAVTASLAAATATATAAAAAAAQATSSGS